MNHTKKIEMKRSICRKDSENEQGFVLVTVIVLLAILSIIGTVSLFKSSIEIKVSAGSVVSVQAVAAAEAGLSHNFAYWKWNDQVTNETASGTTEKENVATAANQGTATSGVYNEAATGTTAPTDATIQGASTAYRVYNISPTGMALVANSTWATVNTPQVAVWATRYNSQSSPAYPYTSFPTAGNGCPDCNVVVYALGRAGTPGRNDSRRMLREIQMTASSLLEGVSAMTNAPAYATWQDACDGAYNSSPAGGNDKDGNTPGPNGTPNESTIDWAIEVTQAEYTLGSIPSGIAYASNTNVGPGAKSFRNDVSTTTVATMDSDPLLIYSGHGSTTAMKVDLMSTTQDTTTPTAPDLPANKLPRRLLDQPLIGTTDVLDFFDPADPNKQLFNLDAYRWAAEQFTCQNTGDATTAAATHTADGKFCSKAEALRLALVAQGYSATAPVTGRLTLAEFMYNISKSIPMFGMVRVMYPVYYQSTSPTTCANYKGGAKVLLYDTAAPTQGIYAGSYTGSETSYSTDGKVGAGDAKLIVYGSVLYDFFTDMDSDGFFDPSVSAIKDGFTVYEHLADAFEAVDARMELEIADFVNPALPNIPSGSLSAFPTAAGGTIVVGSSSNDVNLASPTNGWFPASEGMIPVNTTIDYGQMELMNLTSGVSKLNSLAAAIKTAGGLSGTAATDAQTYFSSVKTRLNYYYDFMKATAKQSDANSWPMDDFPADMTKNFCIGSDDCVTSDPATMTNNDGDKVHLLFPSAYMHGWKVALAALNLSANDWNHLLDGIDTLSANFTGTYGENYGSTGIPKGAPFNKDLDSGFSRALPADPYALIPEQNKYFKTDSGTGGYALLTSNWVDIPAQMYAGGLVDIHEISNVSGVTYTPGPLEWETGHSGLSTPTSYFNGPIITGFGSFNENKGTSYTVLVYDNQSVDNLHTNTTDIVMQRYGKEGL